MGKHEAPPFRMVIENGRLVPATGYDAERLSTYRRGTKVFVRFTEEKDRVLVRKWFAIIGKAVKECKTPWQTKDQASEAIKLSLGIVNLSKTITGAFMQYPKSLTELTDPELEEAVEQMTAIIQHITGVDPAEWRNQIADLGEEEQNTSDDTPPLSGVAGEVEQGSLAQPNTADEADQPDDALDPPSEVSSGPTTLSDEDKDNLLALIKRLKAAVGIDPDVVKMARNSFAAEQRPMSALAKQKAETIVGNFKDACGHTQDEDARRAMAKAITLSCGIAQVDELELGMI